MLDARPLELAGLVELRPKRFGDDRGFFFESWNEARFAEAGVAARWVQDNHSLSRERGVLRGLHLQCAPTAQAKLVRVSRGSVFDVAVDLRDGSATYGCWAGVTLSAEEGNQLFIPEGFAHGFVTLEPDCEVQYKASAYYSPADERTIRFDDPEIGIEWPVEPSAVILSERDRLALRLADCDLGP